jgi:integrase
MSVQEMGDWLALLDANQFAQRHDLPELARFMLATGLRLGEALGVTWSDVDLADGTIAVRRTVVRKRAGGSSPNGSSLGRPSGDSSYRRGASSCCGLGGCGWAPSTARCSQTRGVAGGPEQRPQAFRSVRGGSHFEWVKTHTYRKTVATLLEQSGASARMIADQLGHSRVSMTQDVYLGRRAGNAGNLVALEAYNPDRAARPVSGEDGTR